MGEQATGMERLRSKAGRAIAGPIMSTFDDPEPRPRFFPIISVDDHVVEPPHLFEGRLPRHLQDRAPRVVETARGTQEWVFEDTRQAQVALNAVVGQRPEDAAKEPVRFDQIRRGAWDPIHRVRDMDINGVYASLNFPSALSGFGGQRLQLGRDPELALAVVRAWNDWIMEEWVAPFPDRFIPAQLPWLLDPMLGADEIRRNAERGFKAVTFPESPFAIGLPSVHTGHWDPIMAACEETGTVLCLHVSSSANLSGVSPDAPVDTVGVLFFAYAMFSAVDWLYSPIPRRHPDLRICLSEGGIGWVPALLDRLEHVGRYHQIYGTWDADGLSPGEVLQRNFWFCSIDDATGFRVADRIGVDHVMVESDYPHLDSVWPDTQALLHRQLRDLPDDVVRKIAWENASRLFRHPVPDAVQHDPSSFSSASAV